MPRFVTASTRSSAIFVSLVPVKNCASVIAIEIMFVGVHACAMSKCSFGLHRPPLETFILYYLPKKNDRENTLFVHHIRNKILSPVLIGRESDMLKQKALLF